MYIARSLVKSGFSIIAAFMSSFLVIGRAVECRTPLPALDRPVNRSVAVFATRSRRTWPCPDNPRLDPAMNVKSGLVAVGVIAALIAAGLPATSAYAKTSAPNSTSSAERRRVTRPSVLSLVKALRTDQF
jgi:hypothetical protein